MRQSELIAIASAVVIGAGALGLGRYVASGLETAALERVRGQLDEIGYEDVAIEADGLIIELSGRVGSDRDHELIVTTLQGVEGLPRLIDNLVVVAPLVDLRPATLHIQKDDSSLTLTGEAPNAEARDLLGARAKVGNADVEFLNLMKSQDQRAGDSWLNAAEAAIDAVSALRLGRASVERGEVRIEGAAEDADRKAQIIQRLRAHVGDGYKLEVDISSPPPLLSPYVFAARKTTGGLTISRCAAPDSAGRAAILGALRSEGEEDLAGESDVCQIANGAPNEQWTDAVTRAIGALAALTEAELRIVDDRVELIGYVDTSGHVEQARASALRGWPTNYSLDVDVREVLPIVRPFSLTAMKRPGDVRISGYAPSRDRVEAWVERLDAINELALARGAPQDWPRAATVMIDALAELKVGAATLTDHTFVLAAPGDDSERAALRERLRAALPAGYALEVIEAKIPRQLLESEDAGFSIEQPIEIETSNYSFKARRRGFDSVEIRGVVGDETSSQVVLAYARAKLGGQSLDGELSVGDTPPPQGWQRALFAGIEALSALESGEFSAEPGAVYLSGATEDAANIRAAILALGDKTPGEFTRFSRLRVEEYGPTPDPGELGVEMTPAECVDALNRTIKQDPIEFESGSVAMSSGSAAPLDALATLLKACPDARIEVAGHTDANGAAEDNLSLSFRRAAAVRLSLIARGADRARLEARGFGEEHPIADNSTAAGRAHNRRIEFQLLQATEQ